MRFMFIDPKNGPIQNLDIENKIIEEMGPSTLKVSPYFAFLIAIGCDKRNHNEKGIVDEKKLTTFLRHEEPKIKDFALKYLVQTYEFHTWSSETLST